MRGGEPGRREDGGRRLRTWHFLVVVAAYLVVVQGTSLLLRTGGAPAGHSLSTEAQIVRSIVIPVGLGAVLSVAAAAYLRTWQGIFVESRALSRWTLLVPAAVFVTVLAITNYSGLADEGLAFTLLLLVATMMVGFSEELLFRGVGLQVLRRRGLTEPRVALWSSVVFGVAHSSNVLTDGPSALLQAVLTTGTGFVFYLVLRGSGSLVVAMAAHGLWDFAALSTQVDPDDPSSLVNVAAVVLGVILLAAVLFRRHLWPTDNPEVDRA